MVMDCSSLPSVPSDENGIHEPYAHVSPEALDENNVVMDYREIFSGYGGKGVGMDITLVQPRSQMVALVHRHSQTRPGRP